jgi:hypothetical protein
MKDTSIYWIIIFGFISLVFFLSTIYLLFIQGRNNYSCPKPCNPGCQPTPCPQPVGLQPNQPYTIRTLSGDYVQLCAGCLSGYKDCFEAGLIASPLDQGSRFVFLPVGGNQYQIKSASSSYVLKAVNQGSSSNNLICSSSVSNCLTTFSLQSYFNLNTKGSIYQMQSLNGTYLGTTSMKDVSTQYQVIVDGFKVTDPNTFFLIS